MKIALLLCLITLTGYQGHGQGGGGGGLLGGLLGGGDGGGLLGGVLGGGEGGGLLGGLLGGGNGGGLLGGLLGGNGGGLLDGLLGKNGLVGGLLGGNGGGLLGGLLGGNGGGLLGGLLGKNGLVGKLLGTVLGLVNSLIGPKGPLGLHCILNNLGGVLGLGDNLIRSLEGTVHSTLIPLVRTLLRDIQVIVKDLVGIIPNTGQIEFVCGRCSQLHEKQVEIAKIQVRTCKTDDDLQAMLTKYGAG